MAWIESHQSLGRHPKTKATARALGISRVQLVGHLHYLWWWALDFAEDGDLSGIDRNDIAEEAMWDGDPDEFIDGLVRGGFLTEDMQVHDWSDYTGRFRESRDRYREANRERQRRYRERHRNSDENQPEQASNVTRNVTANVTETLRNGPTLPNPTQPNHTEQNTNQNDDGANAPERSRPNYSESFEKFWEAYPSGHGVKKTAYEQWKRLKPDDLLQRRILAGLERWKRCERWQEGFVKSAHIWLRERWWENEPPPSRKSDPKHLHTPNHDEPFDFFAE